MPADRAEDLQAEAAAFDARIRARLAGGHIPDLRRVEPCDWFYNNPWRRPEYVDAIQGEYLRFAREHLPPPPARILEVACGPGYMSLELARHGYAVTGLDISGASIEAARRFAAEDPWAGQRGPLEYHQADFLGWEPPAPVDAVCFFLSLHHFEELSATLDRVDAALAPTGRIVVAEPAPDLFSRRNAAVVGAIRLLLSALGGWHEALPQPADDAALQARVREVLHEFQETHDPGEGAQSPHDNSSGAEAMLAALRARYRELAHRPAFAFLHRVIGGVRAPTEAETQTLARTLRLVDALLLREGHLQPAAFCFAGQRVP